MAYNVGCCVPVLGGHPARGNCNGGCLLGLEEYSTEQDESAFSTGSAAWVATGHQLVTPVLAGGTYRLGVGYWAGCTTIGTGFWRVRLNGASDVWPTVHNQDFTGGDDELHPFFRAREITLAAASHTFSIETMQTGGEVTTTRQAYFELWKTPPSANGQCIAPCLCENQNLVNQWVVTGRFLTNRIFNTGPLAAGTYRVAVSFVHDRDADSSSEFNIDHNGTGDIFAVNTLERITNAEDAARYMVKEITLGAGGHTFTLVLDSSSSTTITVGQTIWTLHRVDGT